MSVKRRQNEADTATPPVKKAKKTHFDTEGEVREAKSETTTKKPTRAKRARQQDEAMEDLPPLVQTTASMQQGDDIDFPRGGGAKMDTEVEEADDNAQAGNDDLFKVSELSSLIFADHIAYCRHNS